MFTRGSGIVLASFVLSIGLLIGLSYDKVEHDPMTVYYETAEKVCAADLQHKDDCNIAMLRVLDFVKDKGVPAHCRNDNIREELDCLTRFAFQ